MRFLLSLFSFCFWMTFSQQGNASGFHQQVDDEGDQTSYTPFTPSAQPIQTTLTIGNFSHIKEALGAKASDYIDPVLQDTVKPQNRILAIQSMMASKHLLSWLFLADASSDNPLLTAEIRDLRNRPECLRRVILEILDRDLSAFKTRGEKQSALAFIVYSGHFDTVKWTPPYTDQHPEFKDVLIGTRSQDGQNGQVSADLAAHMSFMRTLFSGNPSEQQAQMSTLDSVSCPSSIPIEQTFNWTDLQMANTVLTNSRGLSRVQWAHQLDQLTQSTEIPQIQKVNKSADLDSSSIDYLAFLKAKIPREVPVGALALRPSPGLAFGDQNLNPEFYSIFFKLLFSKLWNKGTMTPESCEAAGRLIEWANFIGLEVSPIPEVRKKQGINLKQLHESYRALTGMLSTLSAQRAEWVTCNKTVATDFKQFWNTQIDMDSFIPQMTYGLKSQNFSGVHRYSFFWDGNPIGYIERTAYYAGKGSVLTAVDVFKADPSFHALVLHPEEWNPGGENTQIGFAFSVKGVSGLSTGIPRETKFNIKVVEAFNQPPEDPLQKILRLSDALK